MKNTVATMLLTVGTLSVANAAVVKGTIKNNEGNVLPNVEVSVLGTDVSVRTNKQGQFELDYPGKFPAELHIESDGYNHINLYINENDTVDINLNKALIEHVDVIGLPIHASSIESAIPVNVLAGEALREKQASTLGETLKAELGVHSTYFGPVSSSPIIRGLDGPRVLITQNSLDVSDASRIGADHVVASETSTAQQIEILRGPATLFYGSGAIGGVVNVVDNRVPSSSETIGDWQINHNTVADENEASVNYTSGTEKFAYHVDAFVRDGKDYNIPEAAELERYGEHEQHDEHEEEGHDNDKTLENSASKSSGFTIGSSYLFDQGFIGFSYGRLDREYGIPAHNHHHDEEGEHDEDEHHDDEEHSEESVYGDLKQDRWQMLSEVNLKDSFLTSIKTKIAYTDYTHAEIEGGEVGTTFDNETLQTRFDLGLAEISGWRGALTFDYKDIDFSAVGAEAFTPPSNTESVALAIVEEKHFGDVLVQLGARIERVTLNADDVEVELGEHGHEDDHQDEEEHEVEHGHVEFNELDYTPVSFSIGAVWDFADGYNVAFSYSHAERAPSAAEVFSFGPHIGTSTYEVGAYFELHEEEHDEDHEGEEHEGEEHHEEEHYDAHFDIAEHKPEIEKSQNIDLTFRKFEGDFGFIISAFYNQVDDYYYQDNTGLFFEEHGHHDEHGDEHHEEEGHEEEHHEGEEHDEHEGGLPIYVYKQADAEFYGVEAQFIWQLNDTFKATLLADTIRGKLKSGDNLPRIPPSRLGLITNADFNDWRAELSIIHNFEQDDIAPYETTTDSYTMVDFSANYYFTAAQKDMSVFFKARNLTDEAARVHTSFIKNQTLLPGRGFTLGIRGEF